MHQYDLIVLGSGTAGQEAAFTARDTGWSVAMVDPNPPGGTCPNRGCDAKKPLVNAVSALIAANRLDTYGLVSTARVDWPALMAFKRSFTSPVPDRTRDKFHEAGIDFFGGEARFIGVGMSARGAVEIIIADIALQAGLLSVPDPTPLVIQYLFSAIVLMAIVTTLLTPIGLRLLLTPSNK